MNIEQNAALLEVQRDIERASRHIELEWSGVVDSWEDVASEISLLLLRDSYATVVRDMDSKPRKKVLHKIGQQIASGMRVDYDHFTGNFRYSTNEIRKYLDDGALDSVGYDFDPSEMYLGEAGEPTVTTKVEDFDLRVAFSRLTNNYKEILLRRYFKAEVLNDIEHKVVTRAVDALTNEMNTSFNKVRAGYDGPGSRGSS